MYSPGKIPRTAKREVRKSQIDFFVKSKESGNISRMQPASMHLTTYMNQNQLRSNIYSMYIFFIHRKHILLGLRLTSFCYQHFSKCSCIPLYSVKYYDIKICNFKTMF